MRSSSEERPEDAAVRERRVEVARRNTHWTEVEESALVTRGRVLVHADSDAVYTPYRGVVFATGSTTVIADYTALHFYVRDNGELTFLELEPGTWSEHVAKQAAKEWRRAAPMPPRGRPVG